MRTASTIIVMTAFVALLSGCSSTSRKVELVNVTLESPQSATVDGRLVRMEKLTSVLRGIGATSQTQIKILVPQDTATAALQQVSARLAADGFRRVVFAKPRHAVAEIVDETPALPNNGFSPR